MGNGALAQRVRAGDRAAFEELYRDYSERIFGFCVVLLRDADEAADATHDAFVLALQRIEQLRDLERFEPWLFAIARHVCYRRLEERSRVAPDEIALDALVVDDEAVDRVSEAETTALVHAAAAGLSDRDRAVLYLNLKEGLEGDALAAAVGASHSNPYSLLHRAKSQLQRAVGVLVVARFGRKACAPLASLLEDWDGELTPLMRKRVGRHIENCAACQATQARALPAAALAATPLFAITLPRDLSAARPSDASAALRRPLPNSHWKRDGFPPDEDERARRRRALVALLAAALVLILVAMLAVTLTGRHHKTVVVAAPAPAPVHPIVRVEGKQLVAATTTTTHTTTTTAPAHVPSASGVTPTTQHRVIQPIGPPMTSRKPPGPPPTTPRPKPTVPPPTTPPTTPHVATTTTPPDT